MEQDQEWELTRGDIRQRMADMDRFDLTDLRDWTERYLASGLVGTTNMGRAYAIGDPDERQDFAEWLTEVLEQVWRYRAVVDPDFSPGVVKREWSYRTAPDPDFGSEAKKEQL